MGARVTSSNAPSRPFRALLQAEAAESSTRGGSDSGRLRLGEAQTRGDSGRGLGRDGLATVVESARRTRAVRTGSVAAVGACHELDGRDLVVVRAAHVTLRGAGFSLGDGHGYLLVLLLRGSRLPSTRGLRESFERWVGVSMREQRLMLGRLFRARLPAARRLLRRCFADRTAVARSDLGFASNLFPAARLGPRSPRKSVIAA